MASIPPSTSLFLLFNILFFTIVSSTYVPRPPPPTRKPPTVKLPTVKPPTVKPSIVKPPIVTPPTVKPPTSKSTCPRDTLNLGACGNLLGLTIGTPAKSPCCSLIGDLANLEAVVCLCTAIKANVLGINLNIPVSLSLILNNCGKHVPSGYQCA